MNTETFSVSNPFQTNFLDVGDGHQIYITQFGNPDGQPVVYLHGGPGAGHNPAWQAYFNPDFYRIILFDQRGCGQSTPFASTGQNTISALVGDIEKLREFLGIQKWIVGGGSWGSSLALFYAMAHHDRVEHLLLRGVFFATREGAAHIAEEGGAEPFDVALFEEYRDFIPADVRKLGGLIDAYHNVMQNGMESDQVEAAKRFMVWDTSIAFATAEESLPAIRAVMENPYDEIPITKIFMCFAVREFSDGFRKQILGSAALNDIPMDIIHGRLDRICPVRNAIDLHQAFGHSKLHICEGSGHSGSDAGISKATVRVTERIRNEIMQGLRPN